MSKQDRLPNVSVKKLARWFTKNQRILPWRDDPSPYRVWVSEIMLQQTQVIAVIPYFERFMSRFPSLEVLAQAREEEVMVAWAGLGYYSRARNLHKAAREVVAREKFPTDRSGWESLPGVGPYTAGAILSIAYGQYEPILDGNIKRVFSRWARLGGVQDKTLWDISRRWIEQARRYRLKASDVNQALMELGALICTPKNPVCGHCPLAGECLALKRGQVEQFPVKKSKKVFLEVSEQVFCWVDPQGRVLVRKRTSGEWRAGLWDLPGDLPKLKTAASKNKQQDRANLRRIDFQSHHVVTRHKITRTTSVGHWPQTFQSGPASLPGGWRWVSLEDLWSEKLPIGAPLKKTLHKIEVQVLKIRQKG